MITSVLSPTWVIVDHQWIYCNTIEAGWVPWALIDRYTGVQHRLVEVKLIMRTKINKALPPLNDIDLDKVARDAKAGMVITSDIAGKLVNDLLRERMRTKIYYGGLGPADGDFRQEANLECYTREYLIELGEMDPDPDEDEDEDEEDQDDDEEEEEEEE